MEEFSNIVILSVDALRRDHVSCYGYERDTTPFIDSLASKGIKFENAWSTSTHTREAVPSMLTGDRPDRSINSKYELDAESFVEKLDVATGAFHSNPFISRSYNYQKGFDKFDDDLNIGKNRLITLARRMLQKITNKHYARAEKINKRSRKWLESLEGSFLLWNHYMDVHGPYEPEKEVRGTYQDEPIGRRKAQMLLHKAIRTPERLSEDEHQRLIDLYDEEILYTDRKIEEFHNYLEDQGLMEDTLLIITSDHGEAMGEDGFYEHPRKLSEGLLQIPMIMVGAGNSIESQPVSLSDIPGTVLEAMGQETGKHSMRHGNDDRILFAQATKKRSRKRDYGLIRNNHLEETTIHPPEDEDVSDELMDYIEHRGNLERDENIQNKDEEIKKRLEGLGYMGEKSE